jgi:cell volume regulation protein A
LAIAMLAFAVAGIAGGSPFLAVYVAGLWLGNAVLPHRNATKGFAEGVAWLAQIGLFVMLGLLASPGRLHEALLPALIVGGSLLLVARPISVLLCATPFRVGLREQAFMSWAGLRGAVPIVLATIPITVGLPAAERIFDVVFLLVVVFTLIQGPTLPFAARRLGVMESGRTREVAIDSSPLEAHHASLLQFTVPQESRLAGVAVFELRLPGDALITLVTRNGEIFVPTQDTVLKPGDQLLLVTSDQGRAATERRLRAVSRAGRLAGWHGEAGEVGEAGEPRRPARRQPPRPAAPGRDLARDLTRLRRALPAATARVEPRGEPVTTSAAEPPR